jgi:hypothetical protein
MLRLSSYKAINKRGEQTTGRAKAAQIVDAINNIGKIDKFSAIDEFNAIDAFGAIGAKNTRRLWLFRVSGVTSFCRRRRNGRAGVYPSLR